MTISIVLEFLCSLIQLNEGIYRLMFFRYFFLLFIGFTLLKNKNELSPRTLMLAFLSIIFILADNYLDINMEPFFFYSGWKGFHWVSYFYTGYLFLFVLKKIHFKWIDGKVSNLIETLGVYSFEIFLLQMFVFTFIKINMFGVYEESSNVVKLIIISLHIIITTILSILPILFYKKQITLSNK